MANIKKITDCIFEKPIDWFIFVFWHSKFCGVIKLCAIWGFVIMLIGGISHCDKVVAFGLGMLMSFIVMVLTIVLYLIVTFSAYGMWSLFSYTERVLFDRNRIFKN